MTIVTIQKGNPYTATLNITSSGVAYDITGKTIFFTLKYVDDYYEDDTHALIQKNINPIDHSNPTAGISTLILSRTDTDIPSGEYKADFKIYEAGVVESNSDTFKVLITPTVTRRIS